MNRRQFARTAAALGVGGLGVAAVGLGMGIDLVRAPNGNSATGEIQAFDKAWHNGGGSPQWYRDAAAAGYGLAVLSTNAWGRNEPWPHAAEQLQMALDAGLRIAAYARNPRFYRAGIEACGPHIGALQFWCIDVEVDPGVPVTHDMVDDVRSMGVRPLIYSSRGMWPRVMGNDTSFADLPLWDAVHDSTAWVPYGGWSARVGMQTVEGAYFGGEEINLSTFSADFLT
jgi:hypothetical protein